MLTFNFGRLRTRLAALALCLLAATPAFASVVFGPSLQEALNQSGPDNRLDVIVSFTGEGPLTPRRSMRSRASASRASTSARCRSRASSRRPTRSRSSPRSRACARSGSTTRSRTKTTAAPRSPASIACAPTRGCARSTALPYSGKGIGVLINDSGIDGTHADLSIRTHVVQNVAGADQPARAGRDAAGHLHRGRAEHGHRRRATARMSPASSARPARARAALYEGVAPGANLIGYGSAPRCSSWIPWAASTTR